MVMKVISLCKLASRLNIGKSSNIHTTSVSCVQVKALRKLIGGETKKKRKYVDAPALTPVETFSKGVNEGKHSSNSRRATVLNKVFMRYITDLMLTGQNASEFSGLGVEISRVKITPDYKLVNVFWLGKGTQADEIIQETLQKNAGCIRHDLAQLRVMGVVPKIQFIKDKAFLHVADVDARLEIADYGDDFTPLNSAERLKSQLELNMTLDDGIRRKIEKSEEISEEIPEEIVPVMPQDIFGLQHDQIMRRVKKSLKKSHAHHRTLTVSKPENDSYDMINQEDAVTQKEAFRKFLVQRKLLKKRIAKEEKNYSPDMEYIREEIEDQFDDMFNQFNSEVEEEDVVEEPK